MAKIKTRRFKMHNDDGRTLVFTANFRDGELTTLDVHREKDGKTYKAFTLNPRQVNRLTDWLDAKVFGLDLPDTILPNLRAA